MILTVLSAFFGFASGVLPNIIKVWESHLDNKHEMAMARIRLEAAEKGYSYQYLTGLTKANEADLKSVRDHDSDINYPGFLENFRASVRPVTTYVLFFLYVFFMIFVGVSMHFNGTDPVVMFNTVWNEGSFNLLIAVMTFWFGNRWSSGFTEKEVYNLLKNQNKTNIK